jgi:endonuclease/exonuclease/phosphatase family metal-dependent hydrolase
MRLVTWNCNKGPYQKKVPRLESLNRDIAVIQECPKPLVESERCLWFGDNPKQGVTVLARAPYRLRRLPVLENVPKFVVPIQVLGPIHFTLFAVWSKTDQPYRYIRGVVKAVQMYREMFTSSACVLMGDLNSNAIWDHTHPAELNHSALVTLMDSLGLTSAYHGFYNEEQGRETRPTLYYRWNELSSFHIDYCFLPVAWAKQLTCVEVGGYEEWQGLSDHRPLFVDIAVEGH